MTPAALLLLLATLATSQDFGTDSFDQSEDGYAAQPRDEPIKIFQPGGKPVVLRCRVEVAESKRSLQRITWHYKQCGHDVIYPYPCSGVSYGPSPAGWLAVLCGGSPCTNQTLSLPDPSSTDNGLYRCSVNRRAMTMYELEVGDLVTSNVRIRSVSANETVWAGQAARLQCKVESRVKPRILWFRQESKAPILFLNDTYQQMSAHKMVAFGGDLYVSKLEFSKAWLADSGLYVCMAVTNVDFTYKQARLTVRPKYFQKDVTDSESGSLHWLFLVPLALALVPAFTWLVCAWRRGQQLRAEKYAPVLT